jgi:hypothetical protein
MREKIIHFQFLIVLFLALLHAQIQAAELTIDKSSESGLLTWTSKDVGFSIQLIQLSPDFVRAVYQKYDLPANEVERIAGYCDFGTIVQNTSQQQLSYRVANWRYIDKSGKAHPVKTKEQWLEEWRKVGVTFAWTLLPGSEDFGVGDWQQGFTTIQIDRKEKFDLIYTWTLDGIEHQGKIKNLSCAPADS